MGVNHKALLELWSVQKPDFEVNRVPFLKLVALDWGMLLLIGCTYFRREDAIYFSTGAKLDATAGAIEILSSEYQQAKQNASK
ncbi:hypothetical protein [Erwinia sp. LJJL01]|uniref:hypothetical protein n=1 Tax=Erwinia sp. LJJL01 TaxID=3391839 RepID=UPI00105CB7FE